MKIILSDQVARGLAWFLVGLFVVLGTAGLALQVVAGSLIATINLRGY